MSQSVLAANYDGHNLVIVASSPHPTAFPGKVSDHPMAASQLQLTHAPARDFRPPQSTPEQWAENGSISLSAQGCARFQSVLIR